jgi:hypothetical protein
MSGARGVIAAILVASSSCKGKEECPPLIVVSEEDCDTTEDCNDRGFNTLSCIGGICRRPCLRDRDCVLPEPPTDPSDVCFGKVEPQKPAICEDQLCADACTDDSSCGSGQRCNAGRCGYYAESFEPRSPGAPVALATLGFNQLGTELPNARTAIAFEGVRGCNLGDELCAGFAGDGLYFVILETVPTPEKGTPDVDLTCRPCACCLECILDPPQFDARIPTCPVDTTVPIALACPGSIPSVCQDVCTDCQACPGSSRTLGERLLTCEQDAARKTCSTCPQCDATACESCRTSSCPACTNVDSDACKTCEASSCSACTSCRACNVCSRASSCLLTDPGSAECRANVADCDAQGNDGCYPTPIHYPRAQLTDLEQSLVSPAIDLSGASGAVTLTFDSVAFNVGERYRPGIQGTPAAQWPEVDQEVVVQFCGGGCETPASWIDGAIPSGARAAFPPATQRSNGLSLGRQSTVDWGAGRIEVVIPDSVRTSQFRFRFLPKLDGDIRVGVDGIAIRSRP